MTPPLLFTQLELRGITLPNRIAVSPMCTYSASNGVANDFHLVHLGRFALGGAGLVIAEATAVEARGRITHGDLGLWDDGQVAPMKRVAKFIKEYGGVPAVQLAHAGRKAATNAPWDGGSPLTAEDRSHGRAPWPVVGPSPIAAGPSWQIPAELTMEDISDIATRWGDAAERAVEAGFEVVEIHGGHGYLLHSFLSPLTNQRTDAYGGSETARMRLPVEVVDSVRARIPSHVPLIYRASVVDGPAQGLSIEDTVRFARVLKLHGVDMIDCSSGGISAERATDTRLPRTYGFHAPYSKAIRRDADVPTGSVGLIVDPEHAESMLRNGEADIVLIGREMLEQPHWAHHARTQLTGRDYADWNQQSGWWLDKRIPLLESLEATEA